MGQVHWSEPALEDLREIVSSVARDSPAYAARLAAQISAKPRASCPRFRQSGRSYPNSASRRFASSGSVPTASSTWFASPTATFLRSLTRAGIFRDSHRSRSQMATAMPQAARRVEGQSRLSACYWRDPKSITMAEMGV